MTYVKYHKTKVKYYFILYYTIFNLSIAHKLCILLNFCIEPNGRIILTFKNTKYLFRKCNHYYMMLFKSVVPNTIKYIIYDWPLCV